MTTKLDHLLRSCLLTSVLSSFAALAQSDPGAPGPFAVSSASYDYGDEAFDFMGRPTELRAIVYYPTDLSGSPIPLVVFLHGWHPTCYRGSVARLAWPCIAPDEPIPSYLGYRYEQEILASHRYIVVSISANGVNARDTQFFDVGMLWRAQLLQRHLEQWTTFNTVGAEPFGDLFVSKVDLGRVGTMGHSRGGEGVARHYVYNKEQGSPYGVQAVLPLAPVNFSREDLDTNINVLLPYCDGDVSDLQGAHFFDDAQYILGDQSNKHFTLVMGGNHAFYNTIWTPGGWPAATWDDWYAFEDPFRQDSWCGFGSPHKLPPAETRATFVAYGTAFYRTYLGGEPDFIPLLKGDAPPPPSAMTDEIYVSYHAKGAARLDLNPLVSEMDLTMNVLGGAVTPSGLNPYDLCGGDLPQPRHCLPAPPTGLVKNQPHTTPSARSARRGLSQLRFGWDDAAGSWGNGLLGTDVSGYSVVQFRASVNFDDPRNTGVPQDLSVRLTDVSGGVATAIVSGSSGALFFPPGSIGTVPRIILNSVRIPLTRFPGVDLTRIQSVQFSFDQEPQGALLISDLGFAD